METVTRHCRTCTCEASEPLTDLFLDFWQLYPARGGRKMFKAAAKKLFSALPRGDQERVMLATRRYARLILDTERLPVDPPRFLTSRLAPTGLWREFVDEFNAGVGGVPRSVTTLGAVPPTAPAPLPVVSTAEPPGEPCPPEVAQRLRRIIGGKGMP